MIRRVFHWLVDLLWYLSLRIFYRTIEVEGLENIPADRPLLIVANHVNGLVDPLVISHCLRRPLTLTVKSTLRKNPYLRFLIWATNAIEFHRTQDKAQTPDRRALLAANAAAMAECRRRLRAGAAICIFPEGVSHSDPQMRPLKQGVTRIALDYVQEDGNPGGLWIVPVGLNYEDKTRFRRRVAIRFGGPLDPAAWQAENPGAPRTQLTEEIDGRLRALSLNFSQWREAWHLRWAAELLATAAEPPAPLGRQEEDPKASYLRLVETIQWLKRGYEQLQPEHDEEIGMLSNRLRRYRAELRLLGITPAEVYLSLEHSRAAFFILREFELLLLGLPLAACGWIGHWIPLGLTRVIARKLTRDPDQWATNLIFPGIAIFPLFYLVTLGAAFSVLPLGWALLMALALPYCGWYAVLWHERAGGAWQRSRTFLSFVMQRERQARLAGEGRAIIAEVRRLEQLLELKPDPSREQVYGSASMTSTSKSTNIKEGS